MSWNHEEIAADPSGFTAAIAAVAIATKYSPSAVRENIATGGAVLSPTYGDHRPSILNEQPINDRKRKE